MPSRPSSVSRAAELLAPCRAVALSVSTSPDLAALGHTALELAEATEDVSRRLLEAGAVLHYGGVLGAALDLPDDAPRYTDRLLALARAQRLSEPDGGPRLVNHVAWPIHCSYGPDQHALYGEDARLVATARPAALAALGDDLLQPLPNGFVIPNTPERRFAWAVSLTHMREQQTAAIEARVCVGGKIAGAKSRYPGVLEEALITLRAGKPLVLVAGYGGATKLVADVLQGKVREELTTAWFRENDPQWDALVGLYAAYGVVLEGPESVGEELRALATERAWVVVESVGEVFR